MPFRRAMRWFSEFCGLCLGGGLLWCVAEILELHERVESLKRQIQRPNIIQNNHQQVLIEDPRNQLIRELAIRNGWKPDVNGNAEQSKLSTMPTDQNSTGSGQK